MLGAGLVATGKRPKEFLNMPDTEQRLAAGCAMQLEQWRLEKLAEIMGG